MAELLIAEDELYEQLYDVRREAEEIGNLVEFDVNPLMNAARERGAVQKGSLRELLGLPAHGHRSPMGEGRDGYTCFSWGACEAAFRDNRRLSSTILARPSPDGERRLAFLEMDEPEHLAYRRTVQSMFIKPRALSWWRRNWIDATVAALIEGLRKAPRAELNLQLCARVPVHTITLAMGLKGEDALVFRHALVRGNPGSRLPVEEQRAAAATVERMLLDVIAARRAEPADDVISGMIRAEFDLDGATRPLTDREVLAQAKLIMLAGGGTSWRQMGITLWALLTHPEQFDAVKADRSLIDAAIDEGVRWNPTDPVFTRLCVEDFTCEGATIPAGSVVDICLGAANRDPSRWDHPNAFDLHRTPQPHLGFGIGVHQCLGRNVAASEIGAAINALLDAFPDFRLDPDRPAPCLTGGLEQRGMSALPVRLD
jgi:cytochrome P450